MRQNFRRVLEIMLERRAFTKILLSEAVGLDAAFDKKLMGFYTEVRTLLESSLHHAQHMGVARSFDVPLASMIVVGGPEESDSAASLRIGPDGGMVGYRLRF